MKKVSLLFFLFIVLTGRVVAQFSATLAGYPLVTTGWNIGGFASVVDSTVQLTSPSTNENGYVYYSTPSNLTGCGQFTVKFDFKIKQFSTTSIADGIAFWYISNPPSGFITGGGIGLPSNPNGLIMILDTYDNNGDANNPLETLLGYNGTIAGYTEASTAGLLAPVVPNQNFIDDGNWHHCEIDYSSGNITVYFNYSATPSMTGYYPLTITGYFGFSSSTGAAYSTQSVKNVYITAVTALTPPTVTSPVTYCQYATATPLTATGSAGGTLHWYTTDTATVVSLPGAPTPNTDVPGTYYYYVRQSAGTCMSPPDSIEVIVNPQPVPPAISGETVYCEDSVFIPFTTTGSGILWYAAATGGTGSATAPVVPTTVPGVYTYYASQTVLGCESLRDSITVHVHTTPATPTLTAGNSVYCQYQTFVPFAVTGNNIKWYTVATGGTGSSTAPVVNTSVAAVYDYYVTQTDSGCESQRLHVPVTVYARPAAPVVAPLTYCQYATAPALTATGVAGSTLTWYGPGVTAGTTTAPTPSTDLTGATSYYVTQSVNGCAGDSAVLIVTIDSTPATPLIGSNSAICSGDTLLLTSSTATVAVIGYNWSGPSGFSSTLENPFIANAPTTASGTYTVTVTFGTCSSSSTTLVTVKQTPSLPILGSNSPVCSGTSLNFTSSSTAGSMFDWTGPLSYTANVQDPVINPAYTNNTGTYSVIATLDGCSSPVATIHAEVDTTPQVAVAGSNSPGTPGPTICQGDTLKLTVTDATAGVNYNWSGPEGFTSTLQNPDILLVTPAASGAYTVIVAAGACTTESIITVTVTPTPPLTAGSNSPVCTGDNDTLQLTATSGTGATYTWSGPYVFTSGAQNPFRTPVVSEYGGIYIVTVLLNGCTATVNDTVVVHPTPAPPWLAWLTYCQSYPAPPLMGYGENILWYSSSAPGGTGSSVPPVPSTTTPGSTFYYASQTVAGCLSAIDSMQVTVNPKPAVTVTPSYAVCPHDTALLVAVDSVKAAGETTSDTITGYHWFPDMYLGDTTGASVVTRPETDIHYWVVASNQYGCTDTALTVVSVYASAVITLPDTVTIYPGESYQISPQTNCSSFMWSPAGGLNDAYISNPVAMPPVSTKYVVTGVTESGCITKDSINIYVSTESILALPNAFTPGSGSNNEFKVIKRGIATLRSFRIFDRWGVKVFETTDIDQGWDGTYKGKPQPFGVYVYEIEAVTSTDKDFVKQGNITLIR